MNTELDIVSTLHDIARSGEYNQDDPINERLLRSFLRIHRGKHLDTFFKKAYQLPDEAFQFLGPVNFNLVGTEHVSTPLPKIIRFRQNFGVIASKDDYQVSLVNSEEYYNSQTDRFNQYHPKMKFIDTKLYLYLGKEQGSQFDNVENTPLNRAVRKFKAESESNSVNLDVRAVLVNPDDEPGYNFTTSPYPMPDELIEQLMNSVTARDLNLFLRTKSDEIGDGRHNTAEQNTREEF